VEDNPIYGEINRAREDLTGLLILKGNSFNNFGRHTNASNPRTVPGKRTYVKTKVLMRELGQGSPVRSKYQLLRKRVSEKFG
jgi:hypothetical protein